MSAPFEKSMPHMPLASAAAAPSPSSIEEEVIGLFDQLRHRLFRYLLGFGLPVSESEEVIQECFLALFQHLRQGKSRKNLRGWLFRVAHNLALKRRIESQASASEPLTGTSADVRDPAPTPEDNAARTQQERRLLAVLHALPPQDRRCLALRAEGLGYREIAHVLDMSLGAVALSLSRSLARMSRVTER